MLPPSRIDCDLIQYSQRFSDGYFRSSDSLCHRFDATQKGAKKAFVVTKVQEPKGRAKSKGELFPGQFYSLLPNAGNVLWIRDTRVSLFLLETQARSSTFKWTALLLILLWREEDFAANVAVRP